MTRKDFPGEAGAPSLIHPLLDLTAMKAVGAVSLFFLALLALLVPPHLEACVNLCGVLGGLREAAHSFETVAYFAQRSQFPLTTAVTYFAALLLSIAGGLCLACTRIPTLNLDALYRSGLGGLLLRFGVYGLWAAQFVLSPSSSDGRRTRGLLQLIESQQVALLAFAACVYLASTVIVFALIGDLLYLAPRKRTK